MYLNRLCFINTLNPNGSTEQCLGQGYFSISMYISTISPEIIALLNSEYRRKIIIDSLSKNKTQSIYPSNACLLECDENFPTSDCHSNSLSIFNTGRYGYGDFFALNLHLPSVQEYHVRISEFIVELYVLTLCPLPSHSVHGYLLYWPVPAQYRHVDRIINGPVETVSMPDPLQY